MSKIAVGQCQTPEKSRFYVKREAEHYAETMSAQHGKKMWVYQCGMHFHLTSGGKRTREREAREQDKQRPEG